jgi:uncharacterized membrane protein
MKFTGQHSGTEGYSNADGDYNWVRWQQLLPCFDGSGHERDLPGMNNGRVEAFSDGVIAIIITIMVLELKVPHGDSAAALLPLVAVFLSYVLSLIYVGIYWNNHHHMLHTCEQVTGPILRANLHLLFWLSLFPITTDWMGENHFAGAPAALYGLVLLMAALAYWLLQRVIIASQGPDSASGTAMVDTGPAHRERAGPQVAAIAVHRRAARSAGSQSSMGLPSGSCRRANRPFG